MCRRMPSSSMLLMFLLLIVLHLDQCLASSDMRAAASAEVDGLSLLESPPGPQAPVILRLGVDGIGAAIPIALDAANAPKTVQALQVLGNGVGTSGRVHRAEAVPTPPSTGPPYALVQATVDDPSGALRGLAHEGSLQIERGSVCLIGGTSDFFIALGPHPGWEQSMTVFGHVGDADMKTSVDPILTRPIHQFTHPQFGTVMAMLDTPLPMQLKVDGSSKGPAPDGGAASQVALNRLREMAAADGVSLRGVASSAGAASSAEHADSSEWQIYYSNGKPYYYNTRTQVTQWEKPLFADL
eukprot:gnl/TRDRNA2_/TRDRNA2_135136_c0_seq2.p1 gnl/TRDRNA2_/TRDRNA2_135136_c0~~gnl/TRDRNA2_/TRDRNA2_135136_c0_seq2.p1  ORF type:complete len:298 (+),score=36.57 gnl/TRDRNA2_/TRDRNA2_135136_c0_seq2:87-980(+)